LSKYEGLKVNNFDVVPCAADQTDFFFSEEERTAKRKEYGFQDEKVLLYSGRLYTGWAVPDEIFNFFNNLAKKVDNVVLFLLTPDIDIAHEMKKRFGINDKRIFITKDSYQNVRKYLNMADYGILLRDNSLMNNIAAPTKVAEYMLCGLPLIISKNIKEVSDVILEKSYGAIVDNYNVDDEIVRIISSVEHDRFEIALWGEKNLSKACFVEKIVQTYQTI
jgi:glycosyltransferase involved in cell wall biosynthesis